MNGALRAAYESELAAARAAADPERAFGHLARAHILSQRHTFQHVYVHGLMLKLGATTRDWREVFGQATRMLAAAVFSRIWVPLGNTGRANVSAVKPMPVPEDLRRFLERSG